MLERSVLLSSRSSHPWLCSHETLHSARTLTLPSPLSAHETLKGQRVLRSTVRAIAAPRVFHGYVLAAAAPIRPITARVVGCGTPGENTGALANGSTGPCRAGRVP